MKEINEKGKANNEAKQKAETHLEESKKALQEEENNLKALQEEERKAKEALATFSDAVSAGISQLEKELAQYQQEELPEQTEEQE